MKKGIYSIGGIIILLVAAFVFVLVPALSGQAGGVRLPQYGSFNGVPIKFEEGSEFYYAANQTVQQFQQQGYDFNSAQYASLYYSVAFSQAFNQVVGPMALRDMTQSTSWLVGESALDRALIERFYSEAGEYSQAIYNATPDDTKRKYQESVEKELLARRCYEDFFGSEANFANKKLFGLKASSAEIEFIRKMGEDLHAFEYVSFNMKEYPEEEVTKYGEANKEKFAKYDLSVITFEDEQKAKDVSKRISNEEITFEDAVTMYSSKLIGNSDTGKITQNRLYQIDEAISNEESLKAVLALKSGEISEPVQINGGWAFFRCDGEMSELNFIDEADKTEVSSYIYSREKSIIEEYFTAIANDFIAAAATSSFDGACERFEKTKELLSPFALNYNNSSLIGRSPLSGTNEFSGADANENFLARAFSLAEGEVSAPITISSTNNIVVLRCSSIEKGGTSTEDSEHLIGGEIQNADSTTANSAIQNSPKIQTNSSAFMAAFMGEQN